jgi:copper homeostasis protein CutC
LINELITLAHGKIEIMPGGGLEIEDIPKLNSKEVHIAVHMITDSGMKFRRERVTMGADGQEYSLKSIDVEMLKRVVAAL